jgi:hypothetical protein
MFGDSSKGLFQGYYKEIDLFRRRSKSVFVAYSTGIMRTTILHTERHHLQLVSVTKYRFVGVHNEFEGK